MLSTVNSRARTGVAPRQAPMPSSRTRDNRRRSRNRGRRFSVTRSRQLSSVMSCCNSRRPRPSPPTIEVAGVPSVDHESDSVAPATAAGWFSRDPDRSGTYSAGRCASAGVSRVVPVPMSSCSVRPAERSSACSSAVTTVVRCPARLVDDRTTPHLGLVGLIGCTTENRSRKALAWKDIAGNRVAGPCAPSGRP